MFLEVDEAHTLAIGQILQPVDGLQSLAESRHAG
jgi:hypothetical protein